MFCNCSSLKKLNISNFNTDKVTNMWSMFFKCSSLNDLDLSHFNTKKVMDMCYMFQECSKELKSKMKALNKFPENACNFVYKY